MISAIISGGRMREQASSMGGLTADIVVMDQDNNWLLDERPGLGDGASQSAGGVPMPVGSSSCYPKI